MIAANIEAWQYGPVFREVYHQFKKFDRSPIKGRAKVLNLETAEYEVADYQGEQIEYSKVRDIALPYIRMRPGALVDLSHAEGGPWHEAWYHDGEVNPGMEITNESIKSFFETQRRH